MALEQEYSLRDHVAISGSDSQNYGSSASFPRAFSALWIPTAGTVVIKSLAGTIATFTVPVAGTMLQVAGVQLRVASTCTGVVAIFGGGP